MKRISHDLVQGTAGWLAHRLQYGGASEAASMLGLPEAKTTRNELLRMKHTGLAKEFSDWLQANVLDFGHEVEAKARKFAEDFIGAELYPETYSLGRIGASVDGLTMDGETAWECKQFNVAILADVLAGKCPDRHMPQCQQVLMCTGAKRLLFTVSDGTEVNTPHVWVYPDSGWFARLEAGWAQFWIDLANYVEPEAAPPKAIGRVLPDLGALMVVVEGKVVSSNLEPWKASALHAIRSINLDLQVDQDFADAIESAKFCERVEGACERALENILGQVSTIDDAKKALDAVKAEAAVYRIKVTKLVDARKAEIKTEVVSKARVAFDAFMAEVHAEIAPHRIPATSVAPDFQAAVKNKRTLESLRNAMDTELARVKIEARDIANRIRSSMNMLALHPEFAFLFNDAPALVFKAADDLTAIITNRIRDHKEAKAAEDERQRARIAVEEKTKAEAAARAQAAELVRQEREAQDARDREVQAEASRKALAEAEGRRRQDAAAQAERDKAAADLRKLEEPAAKDPLAVPGFDPLPGAGKPASAAPAPPPQEEHAWINLGKMNEAFGFTVSADLIVNELGIPWTRTEKAAKFWTPTQFEKIKRLLAERTLKATALLS